MPCQPRRTGRLRAAGALPGARHLPENGRHAKTTPIPGDTLTVCLLGAMCKVFYAQVKEIACSHLPFQVGYRP